MAKYKVNKEVCMCYLNAKPWDWIPVDNVKNPYCMKCGKPILAVEEVKNG